MRIDNNSLPHDFTIKVKELFDESFKLEIFKDKSKNTICFNLTIEDFYGWPDYDNRATISETYEIEVFGEKNKVTIQVTAEFYTSLKELIDIFSKLEILFKDNIEALLSAKEKVY